MHSHSDADVIFHRRLERGIRQLDDARRLLDSLMAQLPAPRQYRPRELPDELSRCIGAARDDELLSIVEMCLARLVMESAEV